MPAIRPDQWQRATDRARRAAEDMGAALDRMQERTLRLGVTGLRRSGKTVFITALIENLLKAERLALYDPIVSGRYLGARLQPQPDASVPRFDFEHHLATMCSASPAWPEATRGIHQFRLALRAKPRSMMRRAVLPWITLNLDIIDYPGEWLLDLPLLQQVFSDWSAEILVLARQSPQRELAGPWLAWVDRTDPGGPVDESKAREGAALYAAYLQACRASSTMVSVLRPGRFVEPGDLAGAPMLTFCPMPEPTGRVARGTLHGLMEERFESYKSLVVRRFFSQHFARLDRQLVLVDVLGVLNAGPESLADMKKALTMSLRAFRHGRGNVIERLLGGRIDRVLFAATKADHIASGQHEPVRQLLDSVIADARRTIKFDGAEVGTMVIASVKCTRTVITEHAGRQLMCVEGVPMGRDRPTVLFPGDLVDERDPFPDGVEQPYNFMEFRPPVHLGRDGQGIPNIRVDQALNFLLGDRLS